MACVVSIYPHPGMAYGMGFARREIGERLWAGHSGGGVHVGIGSALALDVGHGWAVPVLTNRDVPMAEAVLLDTLSLMPRGWLAGRE
ncbi:hypothetical protein [Sphingomonas sp. Leaf10]|uniref:hypothetical protein n=1 Tax=Sphingomonas sp. Leaf10 TaxID=1735676 RepID=UPI0006FF5530|nr:hypothetical protein [Sphingomonas sp. Leaf10]KQM36366.1 hypothetical protein ASE59_04685 [Sphingomonas sp. Leaf10]